MRARLGRGQVGLTVLLAVLFAWPTYLWAQGRVISPSDVLTIKVIGQPDLDTATRVEPDGTVNFPYIGRLKAAGMTEDALSRTIETRLAQRQIVTEPHVLVETTNFGTQVSIQGQVFSPGLYALDRPTNLTQILARAGGLRDTAGPIILKRHGVVTRYNGRDVASGKINTDRILVQNGDEVYVDLTPLFYVYGFVGHTGEFPLTHHLTVQEAISLAGGLSLLGSESRMYIKRRQSDGQTMEVPASMDDDVQPNDMIIVNERIF